MPCNSLELPVLLFFSSGQLPRRCSRIAKTTWTGMWREARANSHMSVGKAASSYASQPPLHQSTTSAPVNHLHQSTTSSCTSQSPAPVNHLFLHQSISLYLRQSSISLWALGAILHGERSYTQAVKTAAHIEREAGATPVLSIVNLIHHRSKTRVWGINESKSRLGLNPAHDKGW